MRILIIEDEESISSTLFDILKPLYAVDVINNGSEGAYQAKINLYDLFIIDVGLPDISGIEVCTAIRSSDIKTPILILTGRLAVEDKVEAFNAYADDYLTKPFHKAELIARIRALMRRSASTLIPDILQVEDLTLNTVSRRVTRAGQDLKLRKKEFDLLEYLLRYQGQAVTRAEILEHVWDREADLFTNFIDVNIKYLRDKVDRPFPTKLIQTIHGHGYKIGN